MSMYFIKPTPITTAMLIGSTISEDDYDEWEEGTSYNVGDKKMVASEHKCYECLVAAAAGLTADLLDEDCVDLTGWTDMSSGGTLTISPSGQYKFQTLTGTWNNAWLYQVLSSPPNTVTIELKTYFDNIGTSEDSSNFYFSYSSGTWQFYVEFCSDGLFIYKASGRAEVGTNLVKCNSTAAWQNWRFEINKTTEASATVAVYSKKTDADWVSQGTVDCDYQPGSTTDGRFDIKQRGGDDALNLITHISYIKVATGNGTIASTTDSPVGNENWAEIGATNRWKCCDDSVGEQTTGGDEMKYILYPGVTIDSIALLNIESTSISIFQIDNSQNRNSNSEGWSGATGTTPPTGWTAVGTPTDFTRDSLTIKITTDAASEGISQDIVCVAGSTYQLLGLYKNQAGSVAQYAIYDNDHSAYIVAATDLDDSTEMSAFAMAFAVPAGCTSVKISLLSKTAGTVWFDYIKTAIVKYHYSLTTGSSVTDIVRSDLDSTSTCILSVYINYTAGSAKLGELIVGTKTTLGTMRYSPSIGITDYSTKEVDAYGKYTIVERSYAKRMSCSLIILNTAVDEVIRLLYLYRATPLVWVGDATYNSLIVYGYYKDFQVVFARPLSCDCSLEIEGLT